MLERYASETRLLLELKDPTPPMVRRVVRAIERADARERVVVQSFDLAALRQARTLSPALATAALCDGITRRRRGAWLRRVTRVGATAVGFKVRDVDHEIVEVARSHGLHVRAWTVNDLFEAAWLWTVGVDGLITDDPQLLRSVAPLAAA